MTLAEFDALPADERDLWVADWQEKRKPTCPDCGGPLDQCGDPNKTHFGFRRVCYVAMETAANTAMYDLLHEKKQFHDGTFQSWAEERSRSHPYRYDDGVRIGVAEEDLAPWDDFTTNVNASPIESVAQKSPGEHPEADDETADGGGGGEQSESADDPCADAGADVDL